MTVLEMKKGAEFSPDGCYRYLLWRIWDEAKPLAMCIGLNPSTANADKNDATITWLIKSLSHLGFGGFKMTNLLGLITSKPQKLSDHPNPMGMNMEWVLTTAYSVQEIIFCWGTFKQAEHYAKKMQQLFPDAKCFGRNKNGSPWHPLAMMYAGMKPDQASLMRFDLKR